MCLALQGWADEKSIPLAPVVTNRLTAAIVSEVASGYLTSSGSLCDSRPICWEMLDWRYDLGDWGWLDGYGWSWNALQSRQHYRHREPFAEFEGAVYHGYSFQLSEEVALKNRWGMLWDPQIGFPDDCNQYWGPSLVESLENPYLVPYTHSLWIMQPKQRSRTRMGVRTKIPLCDGVSFRPAVETVWSDGRRYRAKFGSYPEESFLGGGFGSVRADLRLRWQITKAFAVYVRLQEYVVMGGKARQHVRKQDVYWAKTSRTVGGFGMEYAF